MALPDLLQSNDPDFALFTGGDTNFFLRAAGAAIRSYCGWHLAPSLTVVDDKRRIGSDGIIMLPSLHVTDVASVKIPYSNTEDYALDLTTVTPMSPQEYDWDAAGYITRPAFSASLGRTQFAYVTYTHGFAELPLDIKVVAYELANNAAEMPSGIASRVASPGYQITLGELGVSMNDSMRGRLNQYVIWSSGV